MISVQLEVKRLEIETMFSNLQVTNHWYKNFDQYKKLNAAIWEYSAMTNRETCPSYYLFSIHSAHFQVFLKRQKAFYDLFISLDDSTHEQQIATTTVAPSVQSKAENAPANATPGQLRLHPVLVKVPSINFASSKIKKRLVSKLPLTGCRAPTKLICNFG